jgi:CP family cyanate transporter-like MFS transporter
LFAGTITVGAAIAVGNVLLPALVKRDFPARIGLMTGVYVAVMAAGATLAAGTTIAIQQATGLDWARTLGLWAIPAIAAVIACVPGSGTRRPASEMVPVPAAVRTLYRDRLAWQVTLFMGLQSLIFYSSVAWLPTVYIDRGFSEGDAGLLFGIMNLVGLPACLVAPVLADRRPAQTQLVIASSALVGAGLLGVVLAPEFTPVLWMLLLGLGQGSAIGLALALIGLRAGDSARAAQLSGMAQSIGYLIAAVGPFLLGVVHERTGSWALAFAITLVALGLQVVSGLGAARDRHVGGPRPA